MALSASFRRRVIAWFLLGVAGALVAGCQSSSAGSTDRVGGGKYFTPANTTGDLRLPVNLRRVLLLPVSGGTIVPPETAATLEEVFVIELQRQLRFEVVRMTREECQQWFGAPDFSSVGVLPHDFLPTLGRKYAADAVLFVDVTAYRGFRPLVLGVRAKLATIEQTRLVWTFDEIFSAEDPAVSNSVRHYYGAADSSGIPLNPGHGALQSPGKFAAYVAAATFDTLPPR